MKIYNALFVGGPEHGKRRGYQQPRLEVPVLESRLVVGEDQSLYFSPRKSVVYRYCRVHLGGSRYPEPEAPVHLSIACWVPEDMDPKEAERLLMTMVHIP